MTKQSQVREVTDYLERLVGSQVKTVRVRGAWFRLLEDCGIGTKTEQGIQYKGLEVIRA